MRSLSVKVCLLGDFAVGKTSLVSRFVHNIFKDKYLSTIGVKVSRKVVAVTGESEVVELTILLWDLAGSEEFDHMRASYLRGAAGALLVCDFTRPSTAESLSTYVRALRSITPQAQIVLAANKSDLLGQAQSGPEQEWMAQTQSLLSELGAPWYRTSAKTGEGVEDAFRHLGRLLVQGQP